MDSIRYQRLSKFLKVSQIGGDLAGLFFPRVCLECERLLLREQQVLCWVCRAEVACCEFSFHRGNRLEELFYGRVNIKAATSYFYFKKSGIVQGLMHNLKYKGRQDVGNWVAEMLAEEMIESGRFSTIDVVVPVPLHPKKKRKRGYNQVSQFAKFLADGLGAVCQEDSLIRNRDDSSLTRKNRVERSEILTRAFSIPDSNGLTGKHVLLVDDIITSGSTLEACAKIILKLPDSEVSLASMAFTL